MNIKAVEQKYSLARELFAQREVDTDNALRKLASLSISVHCWQGDDVGGFDRAESRPPGGGLQVSGGYPGKARTIEELQDDLSQALSLIPGKHRVNLHAMYADLRGRPADRDGLGPEHFSGWADWAVEKGLGLDFNASCFSHPLAGSGYTLSHPDQAVRRFWVEHVKRCREIGAWFGRRLGTPCLHNLWIPDGSKDVPTDRWGARAALLKSLDEIYEIEYSPQQMKDSVESKLFGIGSESFVVGSHEFYLGYALTRGKIVCLDLGHFHPTESVADKISAILPFSGEILLHVSRGVRWDSDHIVLLNDEVRDLAGEIVRSQALERIHIALDYFDASVNRIGAWVLGARSVLKGLLIALLEPHDKLRGLDPASKALQRLSLLEELKALPFGPVWNAYCLRNAVPPGEEWLREVEAYERRVLSRR